MEKIFIYGAGLFCKTVLSGTCFSQYEIIGIIDSNPDKWNNYIGKYIVTSPYELKKISYDKIIITAKAYKDIAYKLIRELYVPSDKILFVSQKEEKIYKLPQNSAWFQEVRNKKTEKEMFKRMACNILQESLLMECFENGEFEGYREIIVVGEEEHLQIVKSFFSCCNNELKVYLGDSEGSVSETKKYILTSAEYEKDLIRLFVEKKCMKKQCLVIPLFDVESTVNI